MFQPLVDKAQYVPGSSASTSSDAAASGSDFYSELATHSHVWLADTEGSGDILAPHQAAALIDQGILGTIACASPALHSLTRSRCRRAVTVEMARQYPRRHEDVDYASVGCMLVASGSGKFAPPTAFVLQ